MIHGDLKGVCLGAYCRHDGLCSFTTKANILINRDGQACVADFGLLRIIPDQTSFISAISYTEGGTTQWMSPELLNPESFGLKNSCPTKESDCYALGMVIYEVLSGQPPFSQCSAPIVIHKVMEGERPGRPSGTQAGWFVDNLWGILELCWKPQPLDRPSLKALLQCLESATPPSWSHSTPGMNEDMVTNSSDPVGFTAINPGPVSTSSRTSNTERPKTGGLYSDGQPPLHRNWHKAILSRNHKAILSTPGTTLPPSASSKPSLTGQFTLGI